MQAKIVRHIFHGAKGRVDLKFRVRGKISRIYRIPILNNKCILTSCRVRQFLAGVKPDEVIRLKDFIDKDYSEAKRKWFGDCSKSQALR